MSLPVVLRRLAQAEFDDVANRYEVRRVGRGATFASAIRQVLSAISEQPETHPKVREDVREAIVSGYPYAIYYRLEPARVTVLTVFHASHDPAERQRRA